MREKLLVLMKNEGLTSSRLAELLGIQPSGISHILAGRNKPSFDLVQKILRRFPNVNPDWLLLESDQMYRANSGEETQLSENAIFSPNTTDSPADAKIGEAENSPKQTVAAQIETTFGIASPGTASKGGIKRIVVLFDDNTFESYDVHK